MNRKKLLLLFLSASLLFISSEVASASLSTVSVTNALPAINSIKTFSSYANATNNTAATDFSTSADSAVVYIQINVSDANSYIDIENVTLGIVIWNNSTESNWERFGSSYSLNATFESGNGTTAVYSANLTMLKTDGARRGTESPPLYYRIKARVNDGTNTTTSNTSAQQNADFTFAWLGSEAQGRSGSAFIIPAEEIAAEENVSKINVTKPVPEEVVANVSYSLDIIINIDTIKSFIEETFKPESPTAFNLFVEKLFATTAAVAQKLNISRTLEVRGNESTISLSLKYNGDMTVHNFVVYDELPKTVAATAFDIRIAAAGAEIRIIDPDPVFRFFYEKVLPGQELTISYEVGRKLDAALLDSIPAPKIIAEEIEGGEAPMPVGTWAVIVLLLGLFSVLMWKKRKPKKFRYDFEKTRRKSLQKEIKEIRAIVLGSSNRHDNKS